MTLSDSAIAGLTGGMKLDSGVSPGGSGSAIVQSGAHLSVGNLNIGTAGLAGQSGTMTVSGTGSAVTINPLKSVVIGANSNSSGTLHIDTGGTFTAGAFTVNQTGVVSIAGGTFQANGGFTVNGGSLQSDPAGSVMLADGAQVFVQNGGAVDLNGPVSAQGASIVVDGIGSRFNVAQPLPLGGVSGSGNLAYQNGASGILPGGLMLLETFNTTGSASVLSGAHLSLANLAIGADATSANSTPQLSISGVGSSVTQTGAASLAIGLVDISGVSFGVLQVQSGGSFTSGTGPTTVAATGTIKIMGGTYHANGDMTVAGTLQQDAAGTFTLASDKTLTLQKDATVNLNGSVTGGNVTNRTTLNFNGGVASIQALDGNGATVVAAGAHLAADHVRQTGLTANGMISIRPGASPNLATSLSDLSDLTVAPAGVVDLSNNTLLVHYTNATPATTNRSYLATGYHGGAWDGPGIDSSAAGSSHALGFADSADGVIASQPAKTVMVKFTLAGDLNLDGQVGFADLVALAQHYGTATTKWDQGDTNYDGMVNFNDLVALAQNYGGVLGAALVSGVAPESYSHATQGLAPAPAPEPGAAALSLACLLLRRKMK